MLDFLYLCIYSYFNYIFIQFAVVTFSTVGYGDILPTTKGQKLATSFFILGGVAITANLVGVINSMLSKRQWDDAREKRLARAEKDAKENNFLAMAYLGYIGGLAYFRQVFDKLTEFQPPSAHQANLDLNSPTESMSTGRAAKDLLILKDALSITVQDKKYLACIDFAYIWILIFVGTVMMQWIEDFTFHDAFYWSVVTLTTVG